MSTIAQGTRAGRTRTRERTRAASGGRSWVLGGGVFWIVVFAVLLAGVVAVNVTVLRLNLQLDQAGRERSELRADVSRLRSQLSSASATSRVDRLAQKELGLVQADSDELIFVRIGR